MPPKSQVEQRRDELKKLIRQEKRTIKTLEGEISSQRRYLWRTTDFKTLGIAGDASKKNYWDELCANDQEIKDNTQLLEQHEEALGAFEDELSGVNFAQREYLNNMMSELNKALIRVPAQLDQLIGCTTTFEEGTQRLDAAVNKLVQK